MSRTYSNQVMRFRRGVFQARGRITPGCQVLLLRLSDGMSAKGIVSIPRSTLSEEFACAPARITEWVNQAKAAGFLSVVKRARPGTTAVFQGLYVAPEVREGVPQPEVRETGPGEVREGVPQNGLLRYARAVPQEVVASGTADATQGGDVGNDEQECRWHGFASCPTDCVDHPIAGRSA